MYSCCTGCTMEDGHNLLAEAKAVPEAEASFIPEIPKNAVGTVENTPGPEKSFGLCREATVLKVVVRFLQCWHPLPHEGHVY